MQGERPLQPHIQEREYWNRYRTLKSTLARLASQSDLIERIRNEGAIPAQVQDLALKALAADIDQTRHLFGDLLLNFISISLEGTHAVDIEVEATFSPDSDLMEVNRCLLWIDGRAEEIGPEIGEALIRHGTGTGRGSPVKALLEFYQAEEVRFDRMLDGALDRCSLRILREMYPANSNYVRMRLPAQTLIEHRITF